MPSDRSQDKVDSRKLLRLSGKEKQPSDAHAIPEVTTSDLNWLPADHHGAEIEDEAVADPWDINIEGEEAPGETTDDASITATESIGTQIDIFPDVEEKTPKNDTHATSAKVRLKLFNALDALDEWPPEREVESISPKVRLKLFNALDDWSLEQDIESNDFRQLHPAKEDGSSGEQLDILDQDWLNDERVVETVDDGFEEFAFDEQSNEKSEDEFDIGEFDSDAQQTPWEIEPEVEDQSLRRARAKAAAITNLLDFRSIQERDNTLLYLTELFIQMPYSATFRAIQRVAEEIDLDTLKAMVELRQIWMRRTDWWWLGLYAPRRSVAFTWNTARLVCLTRKDYPPELMIDEEWLTQWQQLPHSDPAYFSFALYIEEKMLSHETELLDEGLKHSERDDGYIETGDDFDWYRRVPQYDRTIRDNFHAITSYPYDDRPGGITLNDLDWEAWFNYWTDKYDQQITKWLLCTYIFWTKKYQKQKEKDEN